MTKMTKKTPPLPSYFAASTPTVPSELKGLQGLGYNIKSAKSDYIVYFRYPSGKSIQIAIPVNEEDVMEDHIYGLTIDLL